MLIKQTDQRIYQILDSLNTYNDQHGKALFDLDNDKIIVFDKNNNLIAYMFIDYVQYDFFSIEYEPIISSIKFADNTKKLKTDTRIGLLLYSYANKNNQHLIYHDTKRLYQSAQLYDKYVKQKVKAASFKKEH